MKKVLFKTIGEVRTVVELFKEYVVDNFYSIKDKMFVVIFKNTIVDCLIETGFEPEDFKPVFVSSIREVERIRDLLGNPESFYYRYFQMKKQYLVSC